MRFLFANLMLMFLFSFSAYSGNWKPYVGLFESKSCEELLQSIAEDHPNLVAEATQKGHESSEAIAEYKKRRLNQIALMVHSNHVTKEGVHSLVFSESVKEGFGQGFSEHEIVSQVKEQLKGTTGLLSAMLRIKVVTRPRELDNLVETLNLFSILAKRRSEIYSGLMKAPVSRNKEIIDLKNVPIIYRHEAIHKADHDIETQYHHTYIGDVIERSNLRLKKLKEDFRDIKTLQDFEMNGVKTIVLKAKELIAYAEIPQEIKEEIGKELDFIENYNIRMSPLFPELILRLSEHANIAVSPQYPKPSNN